MLIWGPSQKAQAPFYFVRNIEAIKPPIETGLLVGNPPKYAHNARDIG